MKVLHIPGSVRLTQSKKNQSVRVRNLLSAIDVPVGCRYVQNDGGSLAPRAGKGDVPGRGELFGGRYNADIGISRQPLSGMVW